MIRRIAAPVGRVTVGLAVSEDAVRAVAVKRDRILWATAAERDGEPLQVTIERMLGGSPLPRWPRALVVGAVGPSSAQTKRLVGLPPLRPGREMDAAVRESAGRLFLRNGIPLVTAVSGSMRGTAWGTALDRDIVEAIQRACHSRHVCLTAVAPSVAVIGLALQGDRFAWHDGDTVAQVEAHGAELIAVRRGSADRHDEPPPPPTPLPLLSPLGQGAWRFADAYGAAVAPPDVLAWRPNGGDSRPFARWRLAVASLATLAAAMACLTAPGVAATIAQRRAQQRLTAIAEVRGSVVMAERELVRVNRALTEVAAFDSGAIPATMFLAELTRALPEGAAIVALRLTGETSTLVALAPRAAPVLTALERVPGIEGAEIVGPVTREIVGTQTVERLSVRFRFRMKATRTMRGGGR